MKITFRKIFVSILFVIAIGVVATSRLVSQAQLPEQAGDQATVHVPDSSIEHPGDEGIRAHTNHVILGRGKPAQPQVTSGPTGETPGSLGCVYAIPGALGAPGCTINGSTPNVSGGSGTIAIVDAFDYPTAYADLTTFSQALGIPVLPQCSSTVTASCFQVVYPGGTPPAQNCGWSQESALDIEWAHAMAPQAKIVLVLAASNSFSDLLAAVNYAEALSEIRQISMSWGSSEFFGETSYDGTFNKSGVAYFAASGDSGGRTIWPGVSPNVISAGGTRINRNSGGEFSSETGWSGSGGGSSRFEPRPVYQNIISNIVGSSRGTPDFSFDADPNTGVSVYGPACDGLGTIGWMRFGGTSVSSPALAGIVNLAGPSGGTSNVDSYAEQTEIYTGYGQPGYYNSLTFRDITSGKAGRFNAKTGWDFVTGVGSNQGLNHK